MMKFQAGLKAEPVVHSAVRKNGRHWKSYKNEAYLDRQAWCSSLAVYLLTSHSNRASHHAAVLLAAVSTHHARTWEQKRGSQVGTVLASL